MLSIPTSRFFQGGAGFEQAEASTMIRAPLGIIALTFFGQALKMTNALNLCRAHAGSERHENPTAKCEYRTAFSAAGRNSARSAGTQPVRPVDRQFA